MTTHDDALRTGTPYWPLASGLMAAYPALQRDETCDVAIVGAGITGALAAQRLAESGCDVVVVDQHDAGFGSTAASTGLLLYETDTELAELAATIGVGPAVASWEAGREAIVDLEALCQPRPDHPSCQFRHRPSVYLASTGREATRLKNECALRRRHGFEATWLDAPELRRRLGIVSAGGIWSSGDAEVDPYRLTHRLLGMAMAAGARVYDRTEVAEVRRSRHGVRLSTSRGSVVRASRVVIATGYDADVGVARRRGQLHSTWAYVSEPIADLSWWQERVLIWEGRRPYSYLRTTGDRIVVGGADEPWAKAHTSRTLLAAKTARLRANLGRLFPGVEAEAAYGWAGTFATSPDGLPYIGTHRAHPRTWFALGYGGNGITFSVVAANLALAWWQGVSPPSPFSFDR